MKNHQLLSVRQKYLNTICICLFIHQTINIYWVHYSESQWTWQEKQDQIPAYEAGYVPAYKDIGTYALVCEIDTVNKCNLIVECSGKLTQIQISSPPFTIYVNLGKSYFSCRQSRLSVNKKVNLSIFKIILWLNTLMMGKIEGKRKRGEREWGSWTASLIQRTWVRANSRRQWRTGKPGVQFIGSQGVRHDLATEQQ